MRVPRIIIDGARADTRVTLDADNFRHVVTVLRRDAGDELVVLDGVGGVFDARVGNVDREESRAEVEIGAPREDVVALVPMAIACGIPRGDALELGIRLASEIGLSRLQPLITERTIVKPRAGSSKLERWRRIALESSKQCGRASPLEVDEPLRYAEWLELLGEPPEAAGAASRRWVAVPGADGVRESGLVDALATADDDAGAFVMVIGPEGGLTAAEVRAATAAGFRPVGFSTPVLRTPTAVIYASSLASLATELARKAP